MTDLSTHYGPLKLNSPLVAGSSGLTDKTDMLKEMEAHGAGAVVLKSLFEEEILREMKISLGSMNTSGFIYPETVEYYEYDEGPAESTAGYLDLIGRAKKEISIPVIASINCLDAEYWTYFPRQLESAGADAVELNIFSLPTNLEKSAGANEQVYFDIIRKVREQVKLPVFVKLSSYSSRLAAFLSDIAAEGVDGLVLFNRFYNPDIDIHTEEITSGAILSHPSDIYNTLRWVAIMAERVDCDLVASTGVHSGESAIKLLLAGASAVQVTSALYQQGIPHLSKMLEEIRKWMESKAYKKIDDFKGKLSQSKSSNPAVYSRVQFMKYFRSFQG